MALPPPATPGMAFDDIDTPALVVDLDAFERNLARMAEVASEAGVRLRPHAKTHRSPAIARRQIALGAVGVCCQKVSEAEILAEGGVEDVLITNEVAGPRKLERLALLARRARLAACVDNPDNAQAMSAAAQRFGAEIAVMVEIDVGGGRCGITPGKEAARLAETVAGLPGLGFAGLQAYHGPAQHFRAAEERRLAVGLAGDLTQRTLDALAEAGLACPTVGGGGTGTHEIEAASGIWNELQPGSYVFMDADYARNRVDGGGAFETFEHALFVLATVMSHPAKDRAVLDAGLKALAFDSGPPKLWNRPGIRYDGASDEHGRLALGDATEPVAIGDKLLLVPGHCDPTVNLHDWYVGVRGMGWEGAFVEAVWPVAARGAGF